MSRVPLLAPEDVPAERRSLADGLAARGGFINLYRAMAHAPVALQHFYELLLLLWHGALGDRRREIAILSVVAASDAPYPLGWHVIDAADAGLTHDEIASIIRGDIVSLAPNEAAIAAFARALTIDACVADETYEAVASSMTEREVVELTMICGLYRLVAGVANTLQVDLEKEPAAALERIRMSPDRA